MFEAVNSVISNAPLNRAVAEQASSVRTPAPELQRAEAPKAPFVSPYIFVDTNFDKAVLQIRDSDTGDVLRQFPSEETLASRQAQAQRQEQIQRQQESVEASSATPAQIEAPTSDFSALLSAQSTPSTAVQAQAFVSATASASQAGQTTVTNVSISA